MKVEEYRLRRYKRLLQRLDGKYKNQKGKWITTENNHKVHLNEEGEPDKGNPHVIEAMTDAGQLHLEYANKLQKELAKASFTSYYGLLNAVHDLPEGFVLEVDGKKFMNKNHGMVSFETGDHVMPFKYNVPLLETGECKIYKDKDDTNPITVTREGVGENGTSTQTSKSEETKTEQTKFQVKHPQEAFSKERKDAALWDVSGGSEADKLLRPVTSKVWNGLSFEAKDALYRYTTDNDYGYQDINKMMREGAPKWWGSYDKAKVSSNIDEITKAIDKCEAPTDMWLQRGCSVGSLCKVFNVPEEYRENLGIRNPEKILNLLVSSSNYGQDKAFLSCGSGKGKGTPSEVIMNIYCPKGTKMMYAEPFSKWGKGGKKDWDGNSGQTEFSREDETILQRGTMLVPRKVSKKDGKIYVDVDVIGQEY